ncbi:acyl-coenzyme A amino acid N-acyltransferase 1-like [Mytilus galloprovincialis]|uniref:acyl-coenzyme A amino acid N-acyltransferase 1-like n=1 Tax=Mytilus galloprovincialis TaxID=29158 RepID=UPI003F7C1ABC
MPDILISPENPLVDDKLWVLICGLEAYQKTTVKASTFEGNSKFSSFACYTADKNGSISLAHHSSLSGTYTGIKPMGLFWSMIQDPGQEPAGRRYMKRTVKTPQEVTITLYEGHLTLENIHSDKFKPLAIKTIERLFKRNDVTRVEIKHDRLKGTLFIPPGHGPFPGVLDMFGTVGGLIEFRAAMLANKGFITFALCYMSSHEVEEIETSYLQEAITWFCSHPDIMKTGIGILGVCKGGELALLLSTICTQVKAVVNINGPPFNSLAPLAPFDNCVQMDYSAVITVQPDSSIEVRTRDAICDNLTREKLTQTWKTDVQILYLVGEDDQSLHPRCAQMFQETYPQSKRHNLTVVRYPNTGHLIEPPYLPVTSSNKKTYEDDVFGKKMQKEVTLMWGGETEAHAKAQEDSWTRIIMFFHSVLLKKNVYSLNSQL